MSGLFTLAGQTESDIGVFKKKVSYESQLIDAKSNVSETILRFGDFVAFKGFLFPFGVSIWDITSLDIIIGQTTVWSIPFGVLLSVSEIKSMSSEIYVGINNALFGTCTTNSFELPVQALKNQEIRVVIKSPESFNFSFAVQWKFVETNTRSRAETGITNLLISQYTSYNIRNHRTSIPLRGLVIGMFVKTYHVLSGSWLDANGAKFGFSDKRSMDVFSNCSHHIVPAEDSDLVNSHKRVCYFYWIPFGATGNEFGDRGCENFATFNEDVALNVTFNDSNDNKDFESGTNYPVVYFVHKNMVQIFEGQLTTGFH